MTVFGLVTSCRVNVWPIRKNILPLSSLALLCKRGLNLSCFKTATASVSRRLKLDSRKSGNKVASGQV